MPLHGPVTRPDLSDELNAPYIQAVKTKKFLQTVERANQEETEEKLMTSQD